MSAGSNVTVVALLKTKATMYGTVTTAKTFDDVVRSRDMAVFAPTACTPFSTAVGVSLHLVGDGSHGFVCTGTALEAHQAQTCHQAQLRICDAL
jgi:hypothetical protein